MSDTFRADLSRIQGRLQDRLRQVVQGTAQVLANEMISGGKYSPGTPIDTGFARSSWDAATGGLPAMGSAGDPEAAAARVTAAIADFQPGETLYIANDAPYIRRLEFDAWSRQAPDGFMRPAAEAIVLIVDEVVAHVAGAG